MALAGSRLASLTPAHSTGVDLSKPPLGKRRRTLHPDRNTDPRPLIYCASGQSSRCSSFKCGLHDPYGYVMFSAKHKAA